MEIYKNLIFNIGSILKQEGFVKKGETFFIKKENNWGILNFQKSKSSTSTEVLFTINIGISSTRLRTFNNENLKLMPKIENSHWRTRIGFLLPEKKDYWWKIGNNSSLEHLTSEISNILINNAIPEMLKYIEDESLKSEWLSGNAPGLTDFQRYIVLTTLLKLDGNDNLKSYIDELMTFSKGKPFEEVANEHITLIGLNHVAP